jgi:hypothetical protein
MHKGFWWASIKEGDGLRDLGKDRGIILKWILQKYDGLDFFLNNQQTH